MKRFTIYLSLVVVLLAAGLSYGSAHAQPPQTADNNSPYETVTEDTVTVNPIGRPLTFAVERLEKIYGVPITYEDTKYVGDEVTETTFNGAMHPTIKRRLSVSFKYGAVPPGAPLDVRKKLAGEALNDAVRDYNSQANGEVFTVTEGEKGFHVIARNFAGHAASMEELRPLLDTPITIVKGKQSIGELLNEICQAIPGLSIGLVPDAKFLQRETTATANNEPARAVLDRLVREIPVWASKQIGPGAYRDTAEGGYVSWELRTEPDTKWGSALSFIIVKPPATI